MKITFLSLFLLTVMSGFGQKNTTASYQQNIYYDTLDIHIVRTIETLDAKGEIVDHMIEFVDASCALMSDIQYTQGRVSNISYRSYDNSCGFVISIRYGKNGKPISRWLEWLDARNKNQMREQFFTEKGALIPKKHRRYIIPL